MTRAFETMAEYVDFLTALPIAAGEKLCLNFLPSALFPKDAVHQYFRLIDLVPEHDAVTARLWSYGKLLLRSLHLGHSEMCIELEALRRLCAEGIVHPTSRQFELAYAGRIHVLKAIVKAAQKDALVFVPQPVPFTFRLHPPDGILLDVSQNTSAQRIQGLWITDENVFRSFAQEYERLRSTGDWRGRKLLAGIAAAIHELDQGRSFCWPPH